MSWAGLRPTGVLGRRISGACQPTGGRLGPERSEGLDRARAAAQHGTPPEAPHGTRPQGGHGTPGPDGGAQIRRDDAATGDAWVALWNGDAAHPPEATGMLAAIVAPLAAGGVPVWTAASYDGDIVLVPQDRFDDARTLLGDAGHTVR